MKVDNYQTIRSLLQFDDPDLFYFLQIMKRRKDNPELEKDMILIDNRYYYSMKEFDMDENWVRFLCDHCNARAYLRLNRRSAKQVAFKTLSRTAEIISNGDYKNVKRTYLSVAGEFHSEKEKTWIVDLDGDYELEKVIQTIESLDPPIQKVRSIIPTKNGVHLISKPFQKNLFLQRFPNIDIHTDNPTLLYCP